MPIRSMSFGGLTIGLPKTPDYDSNWFDLDNNGTKICTHNLLTHHLLIEVWMRNTAEAPDTVYYAPSDNIEIRDWGTTPFDHIDLKNVSGSTNSFRVKMWKINFIGD